MARSKKCNSYYRAHIPDKSSGEDYSVRVAEGGWGGVSRRVMSDSSISLAAKGLYALYCSYAGWSRDAWPHLDTILESLNISRRTFYKARRELEEAGLIEVKRGRDYSTVLISDIICGDEVKGRRQAKKSQMSASPREASDSASETSAAPSSYDSPSLDEERVDYRPPKPILDDFALAVSCRDVYDPVNPDNWKGTIPLDESTEEEKVERDYAELARTSVNHNLLGQGMEAYERLHARFGGHIIQEAWNWRQGKAQGREPKYYPQLKKWLEGTNGFDPEGDCLKFQASLNCKMEKYLHTAKRARDHAIEDMSRRDEHYYKLAKVVDILEGRDASTLDEKEAEALRTASEYVRLVREQAEDILNRRLETGEDPNDSPELKEWAKWRRVSTNFEIIKKNGEGVSLCEQ